MDAYRYGRIRVATIVVAVFIAAAFALIVWLAVPRGNLGNVTLFLALLAIGFAVTVGAWFYYGRTITVTEAELSETGPFKRVVSIPWSEIAQVARFEREKKTEIVASVGSRKITIEDGIDRFQELEATIRRNTGDRYSVAKLRAELLRRRLIAATVIPVAFFAVLLFVPHDPLAGWPFYGRVRAVVVDANGASVPEGSVGFFNKRTRQHPIALEGSPVEVRLPAGSYVMTVRSPRYETKSIDVSVETGRTQTVEIRLDRR